MHVICCCVQFLCLKNIRTFLTCCWEVFGMKKSDLFEAFDLFDVRDFGKVTTLSQTDNISTTCLKRKRLMFMLCEMPCLSITTHWKRLSFDRPAASVYVSFKVITVYSLTAALLFLRCASEGPFVFFIAVFLWELNVLRSVLLGQYCCVYCQTALLCGLWAVVCSRERVLTDDSLTWAIPTTLVLCVWC